MEQRQAKLTAFGPRTIFAFLTTLLTLLSAYTRLYAQEFPGEGRKLSYRIIGFSVPLKDTQNCYTIDIAHGSFDRDDSFKKNIIISVSSKKNKIIAQVPFFGSQYTWRYTYKNDRSTLNSNLFHFSTSTIPFVDTSVSRLRIVTKTDAYNDAFVFLDGKRTLYDMNGQPVWYLPPIPGINNEKLRDLRDLKISPQGTITFLVDQQAYEINYNGDILWKGPNNGKVSGKRIEHYHHEFTRLSNGHYMVLGEENALWKLPLSKDSSVLHSDKIVWDSAKNTIAQKMDFGTVIEYDRKGNVVWSWKSSDYFKTSDLYHRRTGNGMFDLEPHENSFFFDEHAKVIYVSFRNISRVIKISYPGGKVLATYGSIYKQGATVNDGLFCYQHSCRVSKNGNLYLFDNNSCHPGDAPAILMMRASSDKDKLKKIWEYSCDNEQAAEKTQADGPFTTGGNVVELPDSSFFVSMCSGYSGLFIVNRDKKLLWKAVSEKWNRDSGKWEGSSLYRASLINDRAQLEKLIFNSDIPSGKK